MTQYVLLFLLSLFFTNNTHAQRQREVDRNIAVIQSFLKLPDKQIDLAKVTIAVDRMIDPTLDDKDTLKTLDNMAASVARMISFNATSKEKIDALRAYLYQPGAWNNNQVFAYDLAGDPKGFKISNKLITNYLKTRKGNCVSMPLLFVILGQKLGINVTIARAPEHFFVRHIDESGQSFNLETTTGAGLKKDSSYKSEFEIPQKAIDSGLYLRTLNKKETVLMIFMTLKERYCSAKEAQNLMVISDFLLSKNPNSIDGMLGKGYAYYLQLNRDFLSKYSKPRDIPIDKREEFIKLEDNNRIWYEKAEALGWREPSKEFERNYLKQVNQAVQLQKQ